MNKNLDFLIKEVLVTLLTLENETFTLGEEVVFDLGINSDYGNDSRLSFKYIVKGKKQNEKNILISEKQ